jgi:hypothetical protein
LAWAARDGTYLPMPHVGLLPPLGVLLTLGSYAANEFPPPSRHSYLANWGNLRSNLSPS